MAERFGGTYAASLGLVLGGCFWGLYWLPAREIAARGLPGAWAGAAIFGLTALALLPLAWARRRRLVARWRVLALCGLSIGTAFSLYATALLLTDVVRVILLFYLTPVWGTLLGIAFLGERMTLPRALALVLGFAGLLVVLGAGQRLPVPRNLGDWMALASGIAWAWGSMEIYRAGGVTIAEQILGFVLGSLAVTLGLLALGLPALSGGFDAARAGAALPWAAGMVAYLMPMLFLTVWPATVLLPGRVGLLLMSEVIVGVGSAALLAGEPFGAREALGSALIIGAGLVEVLGHRARPAPG